MHRHLGHGIHGALLPWKFSILGFLDVAVVATLRAPRFPTSVSAEVAMAVVTASGSQFTVKAYSGDNKTLFAFDFDSADLAKNLAGFTIACKLPLNQPAFYLFN